MARHLKFLSRTILLRGDTAEGAQRTLLRAMDREKLVDKIKKGRYYEKPAKRRERMEYETCNRVYNREMKKRVEMVMKKYRPHVDKSNWQLGV